MNTTRIMRQNVKKLKTGQKIFLLLAIIIPWLAFAIFDYFQLPQTVKAEKKINVYIPAGAGLSQIADSLLVKGLIRNKKVFNWIVTSLGYEKKLRAGVFAVPYGLNTYQVVRFLITAREERFKITFLEGWKLSDYARQVERQAHIPATLFDSLAHDTAFIRSLGIRAISLEGYLLPDTYFLEYHIGAKKLIRQLANRTLKLFAEDSVKKAMINIGLNRHQVLTLASIVEGEALLDEERPVIASLYLNRLKKNMKLQADPTIQYIRKGPPGRLLFKDLEIESPYNTYKYYGLPPGPINNPGIKSILAVLFPSQTNYLYMVAVGDGSHAFTTNLKDHLRAKARFDRVRREWKRKQRNKTKT